MSPLIMKLLGTGIGAAAVGAFLWKSFTAQDEALWRRVGLAVAAGSIGTFYFWMIWGLGR